MFWLSRKRTHLHNITATLRNDFYNLKAVIVVTKVGVLRVIKFVYGLYYLGADSHCHINFIDESRIFAVWSMFWTYSGMK